MEKTTLQSVIDESESKNKEDKVEEKEKQSFEESKETKVVADLNNDESNLKIEKESIAEATDKKDSLEKTTAKSIEIEKVRLTYCFFINCVLL